MKPPARTLAWFYCTLFCFLVGRTLAVPVAVNDSYSTNEDTPLIISTAPFLAEAFDSISSETDTRGFTFQTNIFGLGSGVGGLGSASDIEGFPPGGLDVRQTASATATVVRNSGWNRQFNVPASQTIRVTLNYRLTTDGIISDAAAASVRLRVGTSGTVINVEQVTGKNKDTGWKTAVHTVAVAAGTLTLQFGAVVTNNTASGSVVRAFFDNVRVEPATNIGVLANDTGGAISASLNTGPANGTLVFNVNGTFTYTPKADYSGADSFTYRASDGTSNSNIATVSLTVNPVNDPPVVVGDSYTTTENVTLNVPVSQGVLLNDRDVEGQTLTAALVTQATRGTVTLNANGSFSYVPANGFAGSDSFTYRASDGVLNSNTVSVAITVVPVNDPPTAVNDSYTATKNQVLNVTATSGSGVAALVPAGGTWKYLDNGSDQGTAWKEPGFSDATWKTGVAQFGYGEGDEATVVEDDATPGSPTPGSTTRYVTTYFRRTFTVSDKATLRELVLSVKRDDAAVVYLNGTVISDAAIQNGLPNSPTFNMLAQASATDDGQTFITINPANALDLLVDGTNVIAVEVHQSTRDSSDLSFDLSLTANRGGAETLVNTGAVWRYLDDGSDQGVAWRDRTFPDTSWKQGPAELGYGDGDEATVVESGAPNRYITTYFRHKFSVTNKTLLTALVLAVKRDDGAVVYLNGNVISNATIQNGLSNNPTYLTSASNATDDGSVFHTVDLVNGQDLLLEGENILAVEVHQAGSTSSDVSFDLSLRATRSVAAGVLANDIEPDGQALSATLVTPPTRGTLVLNSNGTFTYTPAANYIGPDSFVYAASDGSFSSNATANIMVVVGANSAPVAANDSYTATEDTALTVPAGSGVLVNDSDSDGDPLTAVVVRQPANGTVTLAGNGSFTYTPARDFFGQDSFTYSASDNLLNSIPATVLLTVSGTPDAPAAVADNYATDRGAELIVSAASGLLANDRDADGDSLTAQIVNAPASGTLSLAADGSFTYTPAAGFSGVANFTYRASDGTLTSPATTVSILVNSRPVAVPDTFAATEDTTLNVAAPGVLANDRDPDDEPITALLVAGPAKGTVTLNANGSFTYVPAANFNGADTFTYRAFDGTRNSADVTVTINVAPVNDPPVAVNDRYELPIGEQTTVTAAQGVLTNDTDPDASALSAQLVSSPPSGTLIWNTDGSFRFTPAPGFAGTVTFTYRASDGLAQSAPATVTLNVENQAAVAISEIMFNAASGQPADEWVEIRNTGASAVSLRGWQFTSGVNFTFPDAPLPAGGSLVVAADLAAFRVLFPAVANVVGSWTGGLSNRGERIRLRNALGRTIDEVRYADQGDWADRRAEVSGGQSGWAWISGADGTGQSLQLRNLGLPNDNGQNWASATPTPGSANTGVAATNLAPLIYNVRHSPQLPSPTQQVHVTASFVDELFAPPAAKVTYRTWTRPLATDTASTPTAWVDSAMFDDGLHNDGASGDRLFGGTVPAFPANTIVEFYVHVSDGVNVRTWPAPTDTAGTQGANCLYFVESPASPGTRPFYRFVMTGQDEINFRFANWPSSSDAALNTTFIAQQGADIDVRYSSALRIRGASSRDRNPRNWRLDIPHDNDWQDRVSINLNTQYIYNQLLGSRLMELAGLAQEEATVVQVRLNGVNHATANQNNRRYGHYIDLKPVNSDFVDEQFPGDSDGNAYKKVRPDNKWAARGPVGSPNVASYISDGWSKETNGTINDWTDLHALMRTFNDTPAGAGYFPAISTVADVDQFVRWFALCTIINHRETNISNGADDDYSMYRGVLDPRFKLIGHDFDTIFGLGDTSTVPTSGIYHVIDGFGGTTIPVFSRFFQDPTIARKYKAQLRDLLETVFAPENFDTTVDTLLPTDWIPATENLPGVIKSFIAARRAHIFTLIPQAFTATTSLPVQNGFATTTSATSSGLSGLMDAARTARITVNGTGVAVNNFAGTWSAGSAVSLKPGLNTLVCKAFDEADREIASTTVEIFYDSGVMATKGGTLTANEVWSVAGGPYIVSSNLTVPEGVTLTVEAGTSVFISAGTSFTVAPGARLLAQGTADAPITFSKAPAATGTWGGIVINGGPGDLETRISYAIFDSNGSVAITARNGARVKFDHLTFRNTAQPYLLLNGSSFEVSDTAFPNATAAFSPVSGTGIAEGGQAVIRDCVFGIPTGANSALTFTGGQRPGPILQVLRNVFNGSAANLVHLHGADAWVEENVFLHCHRNSTAPSASAVSANASGGNSSAVTIIRNLFYDCDHAVTMREGSAVALLQNTIVRITNAGGTDTASAVLNFANGVEAPGAGGDVQGNIIWDATALTRRYNAALTDLELTGNLLPVAWTGPGSDNVVADPRLNLALIPTPATANDAQVRAAFVLRAGSPAIGTGRLGLDQGALVPAGIAIGGVPVSPTPSTTATLLMGPAGMFGAAYNYGYTHYRYSLDGGEFGTVTPTTTPIALSGLTAGTHSISVIGRNDAGIWQTTPTVATWTVNPSVITVVINEILASNVNAFAAGATRPDVIELHNYGATPVDLTNFSVSDDLANPRKFVFAAGTTIPAGGYLLLLGDNPNANPGIHIGFGMDRGGDSFALYAPNAVVGSTPLDSVAFGAQIDDFSIARSGRDRSWTLSTLTPGAANLAAVELGDAAALRINEWLSANNIVATQDFLELYNSGTKPVALGGLHLTDDVGNFPRQHAIAPLSFIGAGGFTLFIADGRTDRGPQHLSFSISRVHETLALTNAAGSVIDQVPVVSQIEDQSQGRVPDGGPSIAFFTLPTPGFSNGTYTAAQATAFDAVLANLRVTELMFEPASTTRAEFIELKNISATQTLDLSGITFSSGITYTFPGGSALAPGA